MRKKFLLIIVIMLIKMTSFSQSISPNPNSEFCPSVNITFTVTLPKINQNSIPTVSSWTNNPVVVSPITNLVRDQDKTTFNFIGRFTDVNIKQEFKIDYSLDDGSSNGLASTYIPTFKYIKSLFHNNPTSQDPNGACQPIKPNLTSISVARCQNVNIPISFSNIKWSTFGEGSDFCWGTITTYEYQLPINWTLNGFTSTGSNWIAGSNNVTITSDLSNGVNGVIRVRPTNSCASGLQNNQTPAVISINRPAPVLSITDGLDVLCSNTSTYSISGAPPGSTVCWSISDPNLATIPASPNNCGNSVTVTKVGTGVVTLTATVTDCIQTYPPVTKQITLGVPPVDRIIVQGQRFNYVPNGPLLYYTVCAMESIDLFPNVPFPPSQITTNEWQWLSGNYGILGPTNYFGLYVYTSTTIRNVLEVRYRYTNACGTSDWQNVSIEYMNCDNGEEPYRVGSSSDFDFVISPNPVKNNANMVLTGIHTDFEVKVFDLISSKLVRSQRYDKGNKQIKLGLSNLKEGTYVVQVISGNNTKSKQIRIIK